MNNYCDEHKMSLLKGESNCGRIDKLETEIKEEMWPELSDRPKTSSILKVVGIVVTALTVLFGGQFALLYNQGQHTVHKIEQTQSKVDEINTELKVFQGEVKTFIKNAPPDHEHKDGIMIRGW